MLGTWKRPAASLLRLRDRYGKRITVKLPFQPPFVVLSDPQEIKELFLASPEDIHPGEGARILEPIVGSNSVILLDEDAHIRQRKLMLPAFHGEKMQRMLGLMTELAEREVEAWPTGQPLESPPSATEADAGDHSARGLRARARSASRRPPRHVDRGADFQREPAVGDAGRRKVRRVAPWFKKFDERVARTDELVFGLIDERRAQAGADGGERDDVLTMLLQARHDDDSPMSDQEIRDELMTALVAGHETTASQLAWALERLSREPAIVARLQSEIAEGDTDEYLSATIHEILRLRPVLPNAEPRLTKRRVKIGGYEYPRGVALLASAYLVHHDPEIYPDPHLFRPERFVGTNPGTYTWIPFGGGRRRCLGASFAIQEMKVVLRAVLERYEVLPSGERPEQTGRRSITFSPDRGATVVLRALLTTDAVEPAGAVAASA